MKKCPRGGSSPARADPRELHLPVGLKQPTRKPPQRTTRPRRPRPRACLRKGCERRYTPRRWNQRYCQDPACLREVQRWQSLRRQRRSRASPQGRERHRRAERARRQAAKAKGHKRSDRGRGHAGRRLARILCGRPGCHERPVASVRAPGCYCSVSCRAAVRRVSDRERKWLSRATLAGRLKRRYEYAAARRRRVRSPDDDALAADVPRASAGRSLSARAARDG